MTRRTPRWSRGLRILIVLVAVSLEVATVASQWDSVRPSLGRLSLTSVGFSFVAALAALGGATMAWRALVTDLGRHLTVSAAARAFLLGQLAKYVPGSIWVVVAQAEMGRSVGVARRLAATACLS